MSRAGDHNGAGISGVGQRSGITKGGGPSARGHQPAWTVDAVGWQAVSVNRDIAAVAGEGIALEGVAKSNVSEE